METAKVVSEAEELPKAIVRRVVKEKLSHCSDAGDISLHKDALLAFAESARIFIHYLSATANDICRESKRQTINADDILKAVEEIEFPELIEPLKASLDEFRKKNAGKKAEASKAKELKRKEKEPEQAPESSKKKKKEPEQEQEPESSKEKEDEDTTSGREEDSDNAAASDE